MSSEEALLAKAREGDEVAFTELMNRHQAALTRFALQFCRNETDAQDTVQDGMLNAWRALDKFRGGSSLRTWLFTILRNACLKMRRRRAGEPETFETVEHGSVPSEAEERASVHELGDILREALRAMKPEAREVLLLRDVEGFTGSEAAAILHVELPAMKSRLHRARLELKERVEQRLGHSILEELE